MKSRFTFFLSIMLFMSYSSEAQLLKKLKEKAQQAVERTVLKKTDEVVTEKTENTIDGITGSNKTDSDSQKTTSNNEAFAIHTKDKKKFFKEDVIIKMHENGNLNQTQYFDANTIAVRLDNPKQSQPGFIDSEGFIYTSNNGEYTKSSIIALQSQGMMVPTMIIDAYKLPPEPFLAQLQKQQGLGMTANPFNGIVEFAFIYKPENFRYSDFKESKQSFNGKNYTKFTFLNEPGYDGSYVLFDDQDRLVEIYNKISTVNQSTNPVNMASRSPGESLLNYNYSAVEVNLPEAREVKMAGQGLMEGVMGNIVRGESFEKNEIYEDNYNTNNSKGMVKSNQQTLNNHKVTVKDLPDSYEFDWKYETNMIIESNKKEEINMVFLIKQGLNYQASQITDNKSKDMGTSTMIFDSNLKTMIMLTEVQENTILQLFPIPDTKKESNKPTYKMTALPNKTVMGFNCMGSKMEDDRYIITVYHTTEAPVKLSNFLSFNTTQSSDLYEIDPRILKQFSDGFITEIQLVDKKKSKNNTTIIGKSLKREKTEIKKSDYQVVDMFTGKN
ncbi:hypothetical protein NO995_15385 [Aestuariibaculum sp. M13]|uniref:hypothetical protein n=1 Tax=Aestuariibaculum sp. M13 TaxID=2967132 RepID=UPI002159CD67|nr:hypothetical protein [Aestuariibaculum sp. M13]MCR8669067.1 hypothetical protein [Aestuariibaculum sp. M13]